MHFFSLSRQFTFCTRERTHVFFAFRAILEFDSPAAEAALRILRAFAPPDPPFPVGLRPGFPFPVGLRPPNLLDLYTGFVI